MRTHARVWHDRRGTRPPVLGRLLVSLAAVSWMVFASFAVVRADNAAETASVVLHDCLLVFRFGTDPRYGVTLHGSEARAVNDGGQVVGWAETSTGAIHAMLWTETATRDLGTLGGENSCALGINNVGQVVGWAETASGDRHAVRWDGGEPTDLGAFPGESSVAYAINDAGQAVGLSWPIEDRLTPPVGRAVLWDEASTTDIGGLLDAWGSGAADINMRGEVVGWMVAQNGARSGFVWSPRETVVLTVPDAACSTATAIDHTGVIAGWADDAHIDGARYAILWIDGKSVRLDQLAGGNPNSTWAVANSVNERGGVVGAVRDPDGSLYAVLWSAVGAKARALGTLGGTKSEAYAINETDWVVGWSSTVSGEPRAFRWHNDVMTELQMPAGGATT